MSSAPEVKIERAGRVALYGRSNVGKSTLLNAALEMPLAIVSRRPQTTRDPLLGIVRHGTAEVSLIDTPGLHKSDTRLGSEMNRSAVGAMKGADVVLFVIAIPPKAKGEIRVHPGDKKILEQLPEEAPIVLVINKVDLLKNKQMLLPLMAAYSEIRELAAVVPISALRADGIKLVLDEVERLLPEAAAEHDDDNVTDRPMRYFAAEYVREQILRVTSEEVPHAVAVTVDQYTEPAGEGVVHIDATIHVERDGQKRIIIGKKGELLKRIGTEARLRIEELIDNRVNLQLHVRITKKWRENNAMLSDFGLLASKKGTLKP